MLHTETVDERTLSLLTNLQKEEFLKDFCLVGGTALSLHIGHRKSIDLDLFTTESFDVDRLVVQLEHSYDFEISFMNEGTLLGYIGGVKVDFIHFPYGYIRPVHVELGMRLASMPDIAAMKLSAIAKSGKRIKDFIDVSYLSSYFSLNEMLGYYSEKFPRSNYMIPLKALTYFNDIDFDVEVIMTQANFSWDLVAKRLEEMMDFPQKAFSAPPINIQSLSIEGVSPSIKEDVRQEKKDRVQRESRKRRKL